MPSTRLFVLAIVALGACSSPQRTAQAELEAAQRAIGTIPAEARDVVPDQIAVLEESVKMGRQAIETGDFQAASASLRAIPAQVKTLTDSLPARQAALRAEMDTLMVVVPRNLEAIQGELARIARSGKLPGGMDRNGLARVRQVKDSADLQWNEVKAQFQAGKLADALGKAHDLKARVSQALLALGLVADERAWSNVTLPPQ
jgi:hypothetical protein